MATAAISSADDVPRLRRTKRRPRVVKDVSEHRLRGSASAGAVTTAVDPPAREEGGGAVFIVFISRPTGGWPGPTARNTRNPAFPPDKERPPSCNYGTKLHTYSDFFSTYGKSRKSI